MFPGEDLQFPSPVSLRFSHVPPSPCPPAWWWSLNIPAQDCRNKAWCSFALTSLQSYGKGGTSPAMLELGVVGQVGEFEVGESDEN